jgi:acetamidase/formamidase
MLEAPGSAKERGPEWVVVESATDAVAAARSATSRMVDFIVGRWGMSEVDAYLLTSVAMKLRLSQVVNEPMFTVSAAIGRDILPARKMFG